MPILMRFASIAGCLLLSLVCCGAAEGKRVLVTVNKRTIGRVGGKTVAGEEASRLQTLVVSVTNQSIRALPAGEVQWTAVVRKSGSDSLKYSGKGELPPLVSFKSAEVSCGPFDVESRVAATGIERDRIDYEIAILHEGKETYRTASVSNFAALAEKAQSVTNEAPADEPKVAKIPEDPVPKTPKEEKPAQPAIIGAEKMPHQKPAIPVAETKLPVEPPPVPQQKFDFFNLDGKRPPAAK
jgi:hypothetical protein